MTRADKATDPDAAREAMLDPDAHYVSAEPYDPAADVQALERSDLDASTAALIWRRFRRRRLAVISGIYLLAIYLALPFVDFLAPYDPAQRNPDAIFAPPQAVEFFKDGHLAVTYPMRSEIDMNTFQPVFTPDLDDPRPVRFLARCGPVYTLLGLVETNMRLFCPPEGADLHLLGADRLGRDIHSRIMHGARLSLTVGLIGVVISFAIGMTLGGLAGYFGGWTDAAVQRSIEIIRSLPELPIWLALSAAIPANWGPVSVFFMISVILGLLDWPGLARAVRSKFLSLREEDYVRAAELMGAPTRRIIMSHMMPNFMSHLVASATLSIPSMILGETALSLLGLGLRPPAVSWGLMLNDALDLTAVEIYPWLLAPMVPVMMVVLAFNFLGDGLRDALDPYS
ncbi:ABC transporter permease [Oceanicella actignis]|uniref:ABC transporter permease n=1 Tax=Oceanicella actignis TaxID=1189325 RepID=UPI001257B33F|nr:peptide/nickel transport system permease protein [Oceanicella actignis]